MAISTSYALLRSIFILISFYGDANCQLRCDRGIYASTGDNCESLAAKCNISQSDLFYHNGNLDGGVHCNSIKNGQFACCVLWQGGVTTPTNSPRNTCGRPPSTLILAGTSFTVMGNIENNFAIGSRVEYQCSLTENNNKDHSESESKTCQSAWNITMVCSEKGATNNSMWTLTTDTPLLDPSREDSSYWVIIHTVIGVAFLFIAFLLCLLGRNIHLHKKSDRLLKLARKRLLRSGDVDRINPEIPIEEQVALLPYDLKWEFPRNRIILGKQLGSGQFGIVFKARQIGTINDPNDINPRTVAVKMIKSSLNPSALECLASELKILIHLGPHLNVVNLLGACTTGIVDGKLLVIEEFCYYGNIRDYLIANRDLFMNELSTENSYNNTNIIATLQNPGHQPQKFQENNKAMYTEKSQLRNIVLDVNELRASLSTANPYSKISPKISKVSSLFRKSDQDFKLDIGNQTTLLGGNDGYLMASEEDPLEGEENMQSNFGTKRISTRDLIYWSFQITSGMNHLANKKVIHGDLASRNVLLAGGNIVKIADFGLSRQTNYKNGTYLKKGEEALPVKWMALESLTDRIFTTQSDVWSFGVLLWELFSLGKMPYPGITVLNDLIDFLQRGERLENPSFMPDLMSAIMVKCWESEPKVRPTFSHLEEELGKMLGEELESHYLKMNNYFTIRYLQSKKE